MMMDFTSQWLGAPAPGPRLNQSGMDHVGAGLSSPFQGKLSSLCERQKYIERERERER